VLFRSQISTTSGQLDAALAVVGGLR